MTGEMFGTLLVMLSIFASGILIGMMLRERHWWKKQDDAHAMQSIKQQDPPDEQPQKRHFRVRADGWVRHDGGPNPLPDSAPLDLILRGLDVLYEDTAGKIPDAWWQHRNGKYDVLWYRVKEFKSYRPPYPGEDGA